jgi:hypothetical protein
MYETLLAEKLTNAIQNVKILTEVFIILKDVTMTWQKWGSKQALEKRKTGLSLMEVFKIALNCRVFRSQELLNASIVRMWKINNEYIHLVYCEVL